MKIELVDTENNYVIKNISDYNSAIKSYYKAKDRGIFFHLNNPYLKVYINPISNINITITKKSFSTLLEYLKVVNFSFEVLFEAENKLKLSENKEFVNAYISKTDPKENYNEFWLFNASEYINKKINWLKELKDEIKDYSCLEIKP